MGKTFRSYPYNCRIQFLVLFLLIPFFFSYSGFTQYREPLTPDVPFVDIPEKQMGRVNAQITVYGKGTLKGEIELHKDEVLSSPDGKNYTIADIEKITIQKWLMKNEKRNYVFYPVQYEVSLKNQTSFRFGGNIIFLNRFILYSDKKKMTVYTFFYDYLKKGKWINSGFSGLTRSVDTPVKGTAYIIELN